LAKNVSKEPGHNMKSGWGKPLVKGNLLSWNGISLTWWPNEPKWYWTLSPSENSSHCHDSPTNDSLLNFLLPVRRTYSETSLKLANIGITSPILTWCGGGHQMGYFGYVGSKLILNSLELGREAVLRVI
jgi:hypothetical protein